MDLALKQQSNISKLQNNSPTFQSSKTVVQHFKAPKQSNISKLQNNSPTFQSSKSVQHFKAPNQSNISKLQISPTFQSSKTTVQHFKAPKQQSNISKLQDNHSELSEHKFYDYKFKIYFILIFKPDPAILILSYSSCAQDPSSATDNVPRLGWISAKKSYQSIDWRSL